MFKKICSTKLRKYFLIWSIVAVFLIINNYFRGEFSRFLYLSQTQNEEPEKNSIQSNYQIEELEKNLRDRHRAFFISVITSRIQDQNFFSKENTALERKRSFFCQESLDLYKITAKLFENWHKCYLSKELPKNLLLSKYDQIARALLYSTLSFNTFAGPNPEQKEKILSLLSDLENNHASLEQNYLRLLLFAKLLPNEVTLQEKIRQNFLSAGDLFLLKGYWTEAEDYYQKEIFKGQDLAQNFTGLVLLYLKKGLLPEAVQMVKEIFERFQVLKEIQEVLTNLPVGQGYKTELSTLFKQKIAKNLSHPQFLSLYHAAYLCQFFEEGVQIYQPGSIGKTGVSTTVDIEVLSSSKQASIKIDGQEQALNKRGYNLVVVDLPSKTILKKGSFDTFGSIRESENLINFINETEDGKLVIAAIRDEAGLRLTKKAAEIFTLIGAKENIFQKGGASTAAVAPQANNGFKHIIIGIKGAAAGSALETIAKTDRMTAGIYKPGYKPVLKDKKVIYRIRKGEYESEIFLSKTQNE